MVAMVERLIVLKRAPAWALPVMGRQRCPGKWTSGGRGKMGTRSLQPTPVGIGLV